MPLTLTALVVAMALAQSAPARVSIDLSEPSTIAQLDSGKLKGEPTQLAWSPDGTQLFLQASQRDGQGMITKPRYYVLSASDGSVKSTDGPPAWATEYWAWKSNKFSPASPALAIDIKEDWRQLTATYTPMGGEYARGGTPDANAGTGASDVVNAANQMQKQHVFSLTLKGETVGEFVNTQFLPGYTFGWAPQPLAAVAYGNANGRLAVMDQQGKKVDVSSTHNVILPAWSPDGKKIVFLQKGTKNKYDLCLVDLK